MRKFDECGLGLTRMVNLGTMTSQFGVTIGTSIKLILPSALSCTIPGKNGFLFAVNDSDLYSGIWNLPFITGAPSSNSIIFSEVLFAVPFVSLSGLLTIFLLYLHSAASLNTSNISLTRSAYPASATSSYDRLKFSISQCNYRCVSGSGRFLTL